MVKNLIKRINMTDKIEIKLYIPNAVSMTNVEVLADMAFYEIVGTAETLMPILVDVDEDGSFKTAAGYLNIKHYFDSI
jgi:hypothetical protein